MFLFPFIVLLWSPKVDFNLTEQKYNFGIHDISVLMLLWYTESFEMILKNGIHLSNINFREHVRKSQRRKVQGRAETTNGEVEINTSVMFSILTHRSVCIFIFMPTRGTWNQNNYWDNSFRDYRKSNDNWTKQTSIPSSASHLLCILRYWFTCSMLFIKVFFLPLLRNQLFVAPNWLLCRTALSPHPLSSPWLTQSTHIPSQRARNSR